MILLTKVEKISKFSLIFDSYKELLTQIQRDVFNDYYFEDMSLSEIAIKCNKTKATITDALKKTEEKLMVFEQKLGLASKIEKLDIIINDLEKSGDTFFSTKLKKL